MYLFTHLSLALPSLALSLALVIRIYRCLYHTHYSRDIIVLSFVRATVLSRTRYLRYYRCLSRTHYSRAFVLPRTRYSRSLLYALFSPYYRSLSFICSSLSLTHSLTYLCVVLLPPMRHFTMRRPCPTPSLSHVDDILVALSYSHT